MAATKAIIGLNSAFFIGDSASPTGYTEMTEVRSITPTDFAVNEVDATHLKSPNGFEESIAGLKKPGSIDIECNYIGDTAQASVDTLGQAGTVFPWKITSPLSSPRNLLTMTGTGYITSRQTGPFTPGDKTTLKFTVKIAGAINYLVA